MMSMESSVTRLWAVCGLFSVAGILVADPLDNWHWRSPLPQGNPLNSITFGDGLYVAVGDAGAILISPDGENWAVGASNTTNRLGGVAYGNGVYLAVGNSGTILQSRDGAA